MVRSRLVAAAITLVVVMALAGGAGAAIIGTYKLTVTTTLTPPNCTWVGEASMMQNGINLTGTALLDLDLNANPDPLCVTFFPTLSGPLTGTLIGNAIDLVGTLPPYTAHFIGTTTDQGLSASGTWTSTVGSLRARGIFQADRVQATAPTLGAPVMGLLVMVLLSLGAWSMLRPQRQND